MSTTHNVTLRPFNNFTDRALFREWLERDHVYKWWGNPDREYRYCTTHPNGGRGVIICANDEPFKEIVDDDDGRCIVMVIER